MKLEKNDFMISFDVESLFTNVPIDETLGIIKELFFKEKPNRPKLRKNAAT